MYRSVSLFFGHPAYTGRRGGSPGRGDIFFRPGLPPGPIYKKQFPKPAGRSASMGLKTCMSYTCPTSSVHGPDFR